MDRQKQTQHSQAVDVSARSSTTMCRRPLIYIFQKYFVKKIGVPVSAPSRHPDLCSSRPSLIQLNHLLSKHHMLQL